MKNLANCKPSEFLAQTVRIKNSVKGWLDATKVIEILNTKVDYKKLSDNPTAEEKKAVLEENLQKRRDQGLKNFSKILDVAFEQNPEKTLEVLALCCFVEPERVDDNPMKFYMKSVQELIEDEDVLSFFSSLARLAQLNTLEQ